MRKTIRSLPTAVSVAGYLLLAFASSISLAQEPKPPATSKLAPTEKNAAQIELLETKVRFETNGDSRKEVHTRVRINNELGASQFARLNFDFNRSFQSVEIPLVRITHASGGTADILRSAITDNPNPAVVDFPAYHDVRVKSVRILGLAPGDLLEYRVITTTTHHPLAPDFWVDHTFDRSGVVSEEIFQLTLPASPKAHFYASARSPVTSTTTEPDGSVTHVWRRFAETPSQRGEPTTSTGPAVAVTTYENWQQLATRLGSLLHPSVLSAAVQAKATELVEAISDRQHKDDSVTRMQVIYDFVSTKIRTVDLSLGSTGFQTRLPEEILASGYATPEDKFVLFSALCSRVVTGAGMAALVSTAPLVETGGLARPSAFDHMLTFAGVPSMGWWIDLSLEVAPFGMVPAEFRKSRALLLNGSSSDYWREIGPDLAARATYPENQSVAVRAALSGDGSLEAKVKYRLRGENELTLRVAFHKTEKEKWKDVAQMLALSDGFRGQINDVTASDPYETHQPFEVEYEISQPKFVDWAKKTVRVPAILPLPGLPDSPTAEQIKSGKPIDLGTPLSIDLEAMIELPAGATAQAPIGTAVNRDYATFSSKYSVEGNKLHASRSYHFLASELPASRAADLNAFLHAIQSDQTQLFTVQPPAQK